MPRTCSASVCPVCSSARRSVPVLCWGRVTATALLKGPGSLRWQRLQVTLSSLHQATGGVRRQAGGREFELPGHPAGPLRVAPSPHHFPPPARIGLRPSAACAVAPGVRWCLLACLCHSTGELSPGNRGAPQQVCPRETPQEPGRGPCVGFGERSCSPGRPRGAGAQGCGYLRFGELHGVGQQKPVHVLSAGRGGEGAPVAVVVAEVFGQHVLDVKAAEEGALS